MKVVLRSDAFKKMMGSTEVETDELKEICIYEDKEVG